MSATDEQMILTGGCACRAIRYSIAVRPGLVPPGLPATHCHCTDCQEAAGAAFITWFMPKAADVSWTGTLQYFTSSENTERGFCHVCGTAMTCRWKTETDFDISAATLDDPTAVNPRHHIFWHSRMPWIRMDDGLRKYDTWAPGDGPPAPAEDG